MPILAGALFTQAVNYILNRTGGFIAVRTSGNLTARGAKSSGGNTGGGGTGGTTESTDNSILDIIAGGSAIVDANLVNYGISVNRKITINGAEDQTTSAAERIVYLTKVVYYQNAFGQWYKGSSGSWTTNTTDPRVGAGKINIITARRILDSIGFNGGPTYPGGPGSGPSAANYAAALQYCGSRWLRLRYLSGTLVSSHTDIRDDAKNIQSAMLSASYTNPNLKIDLVADALTGNASSDLWDSVQGPWIISNFLPLNNNNSKPMLSAIEGPNELDVGSVQVNTTTAIASDATSINAARQGWAAAMSSWRDTNASKLAGIPLLSPSYSTPNYFGQAGTGGTTTLDTNLNTSSKVDYPAYHFDINTIQSSTGSSFKGQGMPSPQGARDSNTAIGTDLQFQAAGTALAGSPNTKSWLTQTSASIYTASNTTGYGTDGKSVARAQMCWFLDFLLLGGKRIFWFELMSDPNNKAGAYGWFSSSDWTTPKPSAVCLHNLVNIISPSKSYSGYDVDADVTPVAPTYDYTQLSVVNATDPSVAGSAAPTNFSSALTFQPSVLTIVRKDGSCVIAIWNEPNIQNSYGDSGEITPSGQSVQVSFGAAYSYSLYDISGSGGVGTMTPTATTSPYATSKANTISVSLYGLPVLLELGSKLNVSSQGDTVTDTTNVLVGSNNEVWGINGSSQVTINGTADTATSSVTTLLYYNGNIYQLNSAGNWYYKAASSASWNGPTTDPRSSSTGVTAFSSTDQFVDSIGVNALIINAWGNLSSTQVNSITGLLSAAGIRWYREGIITGNSSVQTRLLNFANANPGTKYLIETGPNVNNSNTQSNANTQVAQCATWVSNGVPVKIIAGINEPNLNGYTAQQTTDWQNWIYTAVKGNTVLQNAGVKVSSPPMGGSGESYTTSMVSAGIKSYIEIADTHAYMVRQPETNGWGSGGYGSLAYAKSSYLNPVQSSSSIPMIITEMGSSDVTGIPSTTADSDGTKQQDYALPRSVEAIYLPRWFLWWYINGISINFKFASDDAVYGSSRNYGLIQSDYSTVKPVYTALKNLITFMKDTGTQPTTMGKLNYTLSGTTSNVRQGLFMKRDSTFILILWVGVTSEPDQYTYNVQTPNTISSPSQSVTVTFTNFAKVEVAVPNNGTTWSQQTISNGTVSLTVTDKLTLVHFYN